MCKKVFGANRMYYSADSDAVKASQRELIDRIAVGLAHEIRNPLTVIKGYLQLQEKKSATGMGDSLLAIYRELQRIEVLITNIVSLAQSKTITKTPENLSLILRRIYPAIKCAASTRGIITELVLDDNLPLIALNSAEIEQLILHLACNGIEAMQDKGRLTIGVLRTAENVMLYVQDEGEGIAPEQMEQIFEPFYTTKAGNTGLGLAISLSIVERHQGIIEIVSTPGVGSVFKISFPILA